MEKKKLAVIIEDIVIALSIFSLWPSILYGQSKGNKILMYTALFLLVLIFIRRLMRLGKKPQN